MKYSRTDGPEKIAEFSVTRAEHSVGGIALSPDGTHGLFSEYEKDSTFCKVYRLAQDSSAKQRWWPVVYLIGHELKPSHLILLSPNEAITGDYRGNVFAWKWATPEWLKKLDVN